jgi:glycerol kinase
MQVLPQIVPSTGEFARTRGFAPLPDGIPIAGVAGDQQAALFGQACLDPGDAKCTYGTGAFLVVNTGAQRVRSRHGLLTTVAWQIGSELSYALEGSCFVAGAAVQWLRDGLGLIRSSGEVEALARSVESSEGVVFVPALSGLGAPHWDPEARGLITGLTRGSKAAHIARATLEAIAFQVGDLIAAVREDLGAPAQAGSEAGRICHNGASVSRIRVDGGAAQNNLLMQFQSDISNLSIERPLELESTARGAALLAGVGSGLFGVSQAAQMVEYPDRFRPEMSPMARQQHLERWQAAVGRARSSRAAGSTAGDAARGSERARETERYGN